LFLLSNGTLSTEKRYLLKLEEHVAGMGEGRNVHRVLVGQPEGKKPLGRPRHRWENGIRKYLRELAGECEVDSPGSG
jgi:hypothetical protein